MTEMSSVCVIIPAYNAAPFLRRAVESVWSTVYPSLQIAIIDDGSLDETVAVARELCADMPERCHLFRHPDGAHCGVSATRNLGLARTVSDWVTFLDSDDTYLPNRFSCLDPGNPQRAGVDAFYGLTQMHFDGNVSVEAASGVWWSQNGDDVFGIRDSLRDEALLARMLTGVVWATSAITMRRRLLSRTGGFDPHKRIAEDCDLWFRMAAIGNIVPGDLGQPISRYHRHGANTYEYRIEHRLPLLLAMLDAWRWATDDSAPLERLNVFRKAVPVYAERAIVAAREVGRPEVAWALLKLMAGRAPVCFFSRRGPWRQLQALMRERIRS